MNNIQCLETGKRGVEVLQRCEGLLQQCWEQMEQFPGTALDMKVEFDWCWKVFIEEYLTLNQECHQGFSVSDMLFTTLCHLHIIQSPLEPTQVLPDLEKVLEAVRFVGCQHSPDTMNSFPDLDLLQHLFHDIALLIVFKLSKPLDPKEELRLTSLVHVNEVSFNMLQPNGSASSLVYITEELRKRIHALHVYALPEKTSDGKYVREMAWGSFWSLTHMTSLLVPQSARILHNMFMQHHLVATNGQELPQNSLECSPDWIKQLQDWIARMCAVDSSDNFAHEFRNELFAALLPANAVIYGSTRSGSGPSAGAQMPASTLCQAELGFDVASKISDTMTIKVRSIGLQPSHPYYDIMVLFMFTYQIFHDLRLDFRKLFYIAERELISKWDLLHRSKRIGSTRTREPMIVRVKRAHYVHYFHKEEEEQEEPKAFWLRCSSSAEACLFWLKLVRDNHEGQLFTGHNINRWAEKFLNVKEAWEMQEEEQEQ